MDWPSTPSDKILESPKVPPEASKENRLDAQDIYPPLGLRFRGERARSLVPHKSDVDSWTARFPDASSTSDQRHLIQLIDASNSLGPAILLKSLAQTTIMDPQYPSARGSLSKAPALFADKACESPRSDPLKLNHPSVTVTRPAHLSWMDNPLLFADMNRAKNDNGDLDGSDSTNDKMTRGETWLADKRPSRKPIGAKEMLAVQAASRRLQTQFGIHNQNTLQDPPVDLHRETGSDMTQKNHMFDVLAASHALQSKLGIHDPVPWPNPPVPSDNGIGLSLAEKNAAFLRKTLDKCLDFATNTNCKSEQNQLPDEKMSLGEKMSLDGKIPLDEKMSLGEKMSLDGKFPLDEKIPVDEKMSLNGKMPLDEKISLNEQISFSNQEGNEDKVKPPCEISSPNASKKQEGNFMIKKEPDAMITDLKAAENCHEFIQDITMIPGIQSCTLEKIESATKRGNEAFQSKPSALEETVNLKNFALIPPRVSSVASDQAKRPSSCNVNLTGGKQNKGSSMDLTEPTHSRKRLIIAESMASAVSNSTENSEIHERIEQNVAVPDPLMMPDTFTLAICQQREFRVTPILKLSLIDTAPTMISPSIGQNKLLLHLEVGLDGVEAMCHGEARVTETKYWKENERAKRLGKLDNIKPGGNSCSKKVQYQGLGGGKGRGWWIFLGVRFKQTNEENASGKGGKWACWGLPMEACSKITVKEETAMLGGKNAKGVDVPRTETKVNRVEFVSSHGGVPAMDLWEGANEWKGEVWNDIRTSMARSGLKASFLLAPSPSDPEQARKKKKKSHSPRQGKSSKA